MDMSFIPIGHIICAKDFLCCVLTDLTLGGGEIETDL